MGLFLSLNAVMPTTAAPVPLATGTAIKTHQQVATPSTKRIKVVRWGVILATTPTVAVTAELVDTDVAATVTAHVAAGVQPQGDSGSTASLMTLGTSATGYNASAEGSITATRQIDTAIMFPSNHYSYEWSLGREPQIDVSRFLRVRLTTSVTINATTYIVWEE